ncbi:MAG: type IV pili twitching motility protein PilT [Alicyclobacillus sp. RIFOXYA1_FULL_53_8]|nr:MAG: type IV pili twitching motility protein PilT [Alicyclobacillus sp. RIFOXYA1_FULL_53_8]
MEIWELLSLAHSHQASDLHLSVGSAPALRVHGELVFDGQALSSADTETMARAVMSDEQWRIFAEAGEVDFSFSMAGVSRFRMNVYRQRGCVSLAVRLVPATVPKLMDLGLPQALPALTQKSHGLVLVTGPTGSGKSTTLAALIDHINQTSRKHIITLEDPIEYLHKHGKSIIDQREVGLDTTAFAPALRAALRQDPDVILIGEMRDLETISTAITAAETGHLVFATLHTADAVQTVDRIIDVFPTGQQVQIRVQLAMVLQGIVSQRLFKSWDDKARVAAFEVLLNTPAVANLIRNQKVHQIRSVMQTGKAHGMQTMEMHLAELSAAGSISPSAARQWLELHAGVL